ncbi:centromere protein F [Ricinus communis]|uniref:Uncharacterized protein n=1 Tax=Ricinus communis TaxID=3988 RepID=B9R892_RICCO|nr:centromere protein F [Ricinus communis]EEF52722.1 conserved hypothetical protein [Ricinus communis]|eukprot:XP_002510535.1 centromere protein F [Ricinus communis]
MGAGKSSQVDNLFNNLVQILKNQQEQLKTLLEERKFLEDRIKSQHERWASDVRLCEDHISQMNDALMEKDLNCLLQAAKSNLMLGLKHREASLYKLKLEQTEDELADFRSCFNYLSQILEENPKESDKCKEGVEDSNLRSSGSKRLDNEVKRLKSEYEKLSSEKNSEISALLKEKSFVWNQYNVLESSLSDKLKTKQSEVDQANAKIAKVLASVELLQSSNNEKDEIFSKLKAKLTEMEVDRDKWKEENSRLLQELELLKKSRSAQVTPSLKHCNTGAKASSRVVKSNGRSRSNVVVKKELCPAKAAPPLKDADKGSRGSKRKEVETITILETPKLFSASFKVPKLKISSTPVT